jgi:amino acid adenylation domain-containing protein
LDANKSSIGKGLDNTWIFIMDSSSPPKPVLKGCIGELCIGGPLVARGYLNREDLTQEKFINYNHNGETIRVYCTGDVCSLNDDDSITYFGRADTQVKVNGIRIELDEISNSLAKFDSELSVTTQYFKHPSLPKKKLVSFINYSKDSSSRATKVSCEIIKSENPGKFDPLYNFAKSQLPQYMIPQNIFEVNKIPITSAGKVDSKALLSLFSKLSPQQLVEEAQDDQNIKNLEELTSTERIIVDAIAQITQAQITSIDPNMTIFQLGMDSLSAIRFSHLMKKQSHSISVYHAMKLASISNIADFLDAQKEQPENHADDKLAQTVDFIKNFERLMITEVSQKFELSKSEIVDQIYPCTPLQEAMIVSTLSSEHKEYINTTFMKLEKSTDLSRLNNAWNQAILNNETLRTGFFFNSNNQLCQAVTKFVPLSSWNVIKVSENEGFEALVADSENEVFDSLVGLVPPVKFTAVTKSDEIFVIFTIHHALYDGWSLPLILNNVIDAYNGAKLINPPSYRSAVEYILSVDNQASQTFWSGYLKDLVPTQFPSLLGSKNEDNVSHEMIYTSKISMPEVIKACKKFKVTPLTLTQAAWSKFLSLLVGEKDIVFGNVLSGRTIPVEGVEEMTGPCFNTVACRVNLSDATSNLDLVQSIHKNNQEILNYVHTPLHSVLKWIGSSGAMELFNTLFLFQNNGVDSADEANLWTDIDGNGTINYSVTIQIVTNGDSFNWEMVCQSHITNKDTMSLWGKQLDFILRDIIDNPNSDLTHLVPAYDGNPSSLELLSIDKPISPPGTYKFPYFHSGLEYYANVNPELMALHFLNSISENNVPSFTNLTYRELNIQANQIANWLLSNLEVEDSVVMCLPRSPLSIVTAFAISKAGGVYVALDPEMPNSRKNYIVEESKAKFVLTNSEFLKDFEQSANISNVVDLDFVKGDIQAQSEENPIVSGLSPTNLSYMIFTSGTTGQPKGVEIEHHSLAEFIHYINESSGVFFGHKAMNFANVTFDVHILDLVGVVYAGGTICTSPRQLMLSRLQNVVEALKPDILKLTPGVASLLNKQRIPFVKKLLAGGESLAGTVLNQWAPENQLVNCYGPTEVTIGCTFNFNVTKQDKTSNIGSLLKNCSGLIMSLEEPFRPVIRGGIGELCVGGPLVARGYLNRPDLTNEKFINYEVDNVTDRYYRTGDLCRFNLDGTIEYLGRFDDQVKLNGIRVELQEISKTINKCSNEFETKVVYITHPESSKKELVSFVYPKDKLYSKPDHTIKALVLDTKLVEDMQTIVSQAKTKLPAYMVPYHWIPVDSISITMNGKVDMKKLKTLYESIKIQDIMELTSKFQIQDESASQWSEIQLIIREAISSVIPLDLDSVQPSTSFASMGVDSFNAIRVSSKLRQNGWGVSVGDLLQAGCIATLSQNMMNYGGKKLDIIDANLLIQKSLSMQKLYSAIEKDTDIDVTNVEAILPITASQNIFLHSYQSSKFVDSVYTFALSSVSKLDTDKLNEAWCKLQTKNSIYRTSFITTESSEFPVVQVVSRSTDARFTVENIEQSATIESINEYYKDTNLRKFDLKSPPLGLKVLQYTDRTIILFSIMHALYDAFSIEDSFDQLVEFYSGNDTLEPISYKNFVDYTASIPKDDLEHFWKSQLSNISEAPVVFIPPEQQAQNIFLNKVFKFENPETVEKKLGQLGITLQALVIAAWSIVKSEVSQSSTVSFGLYRNGRQIPLDNIDEIVGPCVNVLPLVVDCSNINLVELAKSVQLKLAVEGKYENANLHEVYNWAECKGSLYDTELNILKIPEGSVSESSAEAFSFENLPKDRAFSYIPIDSDDILSDVVPDAQLQTSISNWKTNFKHSLAFGIDNSLYKDGIQIGLMCDASHYTLQTLQSSYDNFVQLFYSIFTE